MRIIYTTLTVTASFIIAFSPTAVRAVELSPEPLGPLLITELQPGTSESSSREFIELYNSGPAAVDLAARQWRLEIAGSTAQDWNSPLRTIALTGTLVPGGHYVAASRYTQAGQEVQHLPELAGVHFAAGIAATGGHVRLIAEVYQAQAGGSCALHPAVIDELEWSASNNGAAAVPSLSGRSVFVTAGATGIDKTGALQRFMAPGAAYADTDNDAQDFTHTIATPGAPTTATRVAAPDPAPPPAPVEDACEPDPEPPAEEPSQKEPEPDPETDPSLPPEEPQEPGSETPEPSESVHPNAGLVGPAITELLPNPSPPQTDADHEFIEVYNPNEQRFDLSGYVLESGLTSKRRYTFPDGTVLEPRAYRVFSITETGLSLANTGGRVSLHDPAGTEIAAADAYSAAKEGEAWIFLNGIWQWTNAPTPQAGNVLALPLPAAASKVGTAKKPATVKTAATKTTTPKAPAKTAAKQPKQPKTTETPVVKELGTPASATRAPLHPGVLAAAGVFALLYGAYEYRRDLANKIHQLRCYRAARRAARQRAAGRGGN